MNNKKSSSIKWKVLNQQHNEYDATALKKLKLLYEGDEYGKLKKPSNMSLFFKKYNSETEEAFQDRKKFISYENNFAQIINDYSSSVFQKQMQVGEKTDASSSETIGATKSNNTGEGPKGTEAEKYWQSFFEDADNKKHTVSQVCKELLTTANVSKKAYLAVETPKITPELANITRAQQNDDPEKLKATRAYVCQIDTECVIDWEIDVLGNYILMVLKDERNPRATVNDSRTNTLTTFKVWQKDNGGRVRYDIYQLKWDCSANPNGPSEDTEVPWKDGDYVDFKEIPVLCLDLPSELYIGGLIGGLCESIFVRYSSYLHYLNRGQAAILVVEQAAELPMSGDISEIGSDENRGRKVLSTGRQTGSGLVGPKDKVYFAEQSGAVLKITQEQLQKDKNELYRLVNQMGSIIKEKGGTSQNSKNSGLSKQMDYSTNKEIVLLEYANLIKEFIIKLYVLIDQATGGNVAWQVRGMENYKMIQTEELLEKINTIPAIRENIPSKTSLIRVLCDITSDMHAYTNPGLLKIIEDEITEAINKSDIEEVHQTTISAPLTEQDQAQQALDSKVSSGPPSPKSKKAKSPTVNKK